MQESFTAPIRYFNRYTQELETEAVYGDAFLKWAYGNPLGRLTTELAVKRALFSHWYGWRMDRPKSREKVLPFIKEFGLDPNDFQDAPESFQSFNQFFYRRLKATARPIDSNPKSVVFPADGRHLGFQDISQIDHVFVKGQHFDIPALLSDEQLAQRYAKGSLILSRLCPVDYHRYHYPVAGTPGKKGEQPRLLNGPLYSVNPIALRRNLGIFWQNKRYLTEIETEQFGKVLMLEIGATCVGSAVQTQPLGQPAAKGDEKGYFQFGGSSTITLFEPGKVTLAADLIEHSKQGIELYARMGDVMGLKAET